MITNNINRIINFKPSTFDSSITELKNTFIKFLNLSKDQKSKMGALGREKAVNEFDDQKIAQEIWDIVINAMD